MSDFTPNPDFKLNKKEPEVVVPKKASFTAYSNVAECTTVMPSGKILRFTHGFYATNDEEEIAHLKDCASGSGCISLDPQLVIHSDALVMKEIGGKGNTGFQKTGIGMNNSTMLANLAAASNAKSS